jgi:hypothetical protein
MKKIALVAGLGLSLTFGACHYGTEEAKKTLETNKEYKEGKADYSINRANVAEPEEEAAVAPAVADSASTAANPAPAAAPEAHSK